MEKRKQIYLSLGSNLGDRAANLAHAIDGLPAVGVHVVKRSSIYETEPVDFLGQPWFLNCVVEAETDLEPLPLLRALQSIESGMGSRKLIPRGPRIIDLDILFYGDTAVHEQEVEIPHPRLADRQFVLVPLAEIAPRLQHPFMRKTIQELLIDTKDSSAISAYTEKNQSTKK